MSLPPVLYQDQRFVVLDKPAGLSVHAGPSGRRSAEDFFPLLSRRKDGPWLAHRLDAETSGCLVIALRHAPLLAAQALFAAGSVRKTYWAVVSGPVMGDAGTVTEPLRRVTVKGGWRIEAGPSGKAAVTDWRVLGRGPGITWLELTPKTGRTHQVRVHCACLGAPVLGDSRYGTTGDGGLHLLARSIHLPLEPPVDATAPPPPHMIAALERCGYRPSR
jgi:tRNA pseudouridine32 synthase/23S rRNA pseudouridine746 synthase